MVEMLVVSIVSGIIACAAYDGLKAVMRKLRFTPKMYPRHGGTITKKPLFLEQKGEAK